MTKNKYQQGFEDVELDQQPPELLVQLKFKDIKKKRKLWVAVVHPNTSKILWERVFSPNYDMNKALGLARTQKDKLKFKVKTWIPTYEETKKSKKKKRK